MSFPRSNLVSSFKKVVVSSLSFAIRFVSSHSKFIVLSLRFRFRFVLILFCPTFGPHRFRFIIVHVVSGDIKAPIKLQAFLES